MTQPVYSSLCSLLLDAENPIRIPAGDRRRTLADDLCALGLLENRKSGWWTTSEAGHRLLGSVGFKHALQRILDKARAQLQSPPAGRLSAKQNRERRYLPFAIDRLSRINARDEAEPTQ